MVVYYWVKNKWLNSKTIILIALLLLVVWSLCGLLKKKYLIYKHDYKSLVLVLANSNDQKGQRSEYVIDFCLENELFEDMDFLTEFFATDSPFDLFDLVQILTALGNDYYNINSRVVPLFVEIRKSEIIEYLGKLTPFQGELLSMMFLVHLPKCPELYNKYLEIMSMMNDSDSIANFFSCFYKRYSINSWVASNVTGEQQNAFARETLRLYNNSSEENLTKAITFITRQNYQILKKIDYFISEESANVKKTERIIRLQSEIKKYIK